MRPLRLFHHLREALQRELEVELREKGALALVEGSWELAGDAEVGAPPQVRDLIEARVDRMSQDSRRVLDLAAVAGMEFSFRDICAARELSGVAAPEAEQQTLDALDDALHAHILEERDGGYIFSHPLVRASLYERLTGQRRSYLHSLLGRAVEGQRPDDVETLAYHFARSSDRERAVDYLERAGDHAAALHANEVAARYYREVVARLLQLGRTTDLARVEEKLGIVLTTMARYDEALQLLEQAAARYHDQGNLAAERRTVARIGEVHMRRATPEEGIARVQALLAQPAPPSSELAQLLVALTQLYFSTGRYDNMLHSAARAAKTALAAGDLETADVAEERRASALLKFGRNDEALKILQRIIPRLEAAGDLQALVRALNNISAIHQWYGLMPELRQYAERAYRAAERLGDVTRTAFMLARLALADWYLGDWNRALEEAESAVPSLEALAIPGSCAGPLWFWD